MILVDRGLQHSTDDDLVGKPAHDRFCKEFKYMRCFNNLDEKVGLAKWRAWQKNHRSSDPDRHTKGMNLAHNSMKSGYVGNIADCVKPAHNGMYVSAAAPDNASKAKTLAHAKRTLATRMNQSRNNVHAARLLINDPSLVASARILQLGTQRLLHEWGHMLENMTSGEKTLEEMYGLSQCS